jgi:hypothetical protein
MTLLDYFAAKVMQGLLAASYGDEGYIPAMRDIDFAEDPEGAWVTDSFIWYPTPRGCPNDRKRYRMLTTFEQRLARDAYEIAAAMVAEKAKQDATP